MKRIISVLLTFILFTTCVCITAFASSPDCIETKYISAYGTLTGELYYNGYNVGRKTISFSTDTVKAAPYILARVEIYSYYTGAYWDHDIAPTRENATHTQNYWEGHDATVNSNLVTCYGCHEARGQNSYVVYTGLYGM